MQVYKKKGKPMQVQEKYKKRRKSKKTIESVTNQYFTAWAREIQQMSAVEAATYKLSLIMICNRIYFKYLRGRYNHFDKKLKVWIFIHIALELTWNLKLG